MKVKLFTRDGGFVHSAEIPPFNEPPTIIIWGQRFFVFADVDGPALPIESDEQGYVEAFTFVVTP